MMRRAPIPASGRAVRDRAAAFAAGLLSCLSSFGSRPRAPALVVAGRGAGYGIRMGNMERIYLLWLVVGVVACGGGGTGTDGDGSSTGAAPVTTGSTGGVTSTGEVPTTGTPTTGAPTTDDSSTGESGTTLATSGSEGTTAEGPCVRCAAVLAGGEDPSLLCPDSVALFDALTACSCTGACTVHCSNICVGQMPTPPCQMCLDDEVAGCGLEQKACAQDV